MIRIWATALAFVLVSGACAEEKLVLRAPRLDISIYNEGHNYASVDEANLTIDLGQVPVYAEVSAEFLLTNASELPLNISDVTYAVENGVRWKDAIFPTQIPPYGEGKLTIIYAPLEVEQEDMVVAEIKTDAANGRAQQVTVIGTGEFKGAPDIEVAYNAYTGPSVSECIDSDADGETDTCVLTEDNALDFGNIAMGMTGTVRLTIRNKATCDAFPGGDPCASCVLSIDKDPAGQDLGFGFKAGSNADGYFAFAGSTATPFQVRQADLGCSESGEVTLLLNFNAPTAEGAYQTMLVIESTDPDESLIEIPVVANSVNAPIAVADLRALDPANPTAPYSEIDNIEPLERVYLDGSESYDPAGENIAQYYWEVVEYPSGSNPNDFDFNGQGSDLMDFFAPLAGHYVVKLTVTNESGISSGDTEDARVEFDVTPGDSIHVQLTWDDPGNDQDLHLVKIDGAPEAHFCHDSYDCFFGEKKPIWFTQDAAGIGANPILDIDDTNGIGPENINIDEPEAATYRVYVHYFSDWGSYSGTTPTTNTVRIYLNGLLVGEYTRVLPNKDAVWAVADIVWDENGLGTQSPYPSDSAGQAGTIHTMPAGSSCFGGTGWDFP